MQAFLCSVFFLSNTFVLLMRTLFGLKMIDQINTLFNAITAAAVIAWLVLLKPASEDVVPVQVRVDKAYEERLLLHLDALNSSLLRSGGR